MLICITKRLIDLVDNIRYYVITHHSLKKKCDEKNSTCEFSLSFDRLLNISSLKKRYMHLSIVIPRSHLPVCTEQSGWQLSAVVMRDGLLLVCRITGLKKIHKGEWEKKIRIWSKYFEFISTMTSDWNSLFVLNQLCIKAYRESRHIEASSDK